MKTLFAILIFAAASAMVASARLTVFAASSLTDVMNELAVRFEEKNGEEVRFNYAASGTLARQIDAGAPADLFVSANVAWMDYLQDKDLIDVKTRTDVAGNELVLIAPNDSTLTYEEFPGNLAGRLALGDPISVPAGAYAKTALESLEWIDAIDGKLIKGANVRTVLMYVERREVDAGIVYRTDALRSNQVKVIGTLPAGSHAPIVYPAACLRKSEPAADAFMAFLKSEGAAVIFKHYGFTIPQESSE